MKLEAQILKEIKISNVQELNETLNSLSNDFIYRGHADSNWMLTSTLDRELEGNVDPSNYKKVEDFYLNLFESKYHIYNDVEHEPKSKLGWLSVMQHYGAPTRLLDFTESPYIALYFALEGYAAHMKSDLSIFAINYKEVMDKSLDYMSKKDSSFTKTRSDISGREDKLFDEVVDRFSYEVLWVTEPKEVNVRIDRQAGTFLISGDREKRVEDLLGSDLYKSCEVYKYVIPRDCIYGSYALLRKMNINSKSIYGDLFGLAKGIKMDIQFHCM
jgi:hypothetical protein